MVAPNIALTYVQKWFRSLFIIKGLG